MNRSNKFSVCIAVSGVVFVVFGLVLGYAIFPAVVEELVSIS
jgi:hypothetical protein